MNLFRPDNRHPRCRNPCPCPGAENLAARDEVINSGVTLLMVLFKDSVRQGISFILGGLWWLMFNSGF